MQIKFGFCLAFRFFWDEHFVYLLTYGMLEISFNLFAHIKFFPFYWELTPVFQPQQSKQPSFLFITKP